MYNLVFYCASVRVIKNIFIAIFNYSAAFVELFYKKNEGAV